MTFGGAIWALLAALVGALVVLSWRGGRVARLGNLLRAIAARPFLRVALVRVWMWAGWHLFAR